VARIREDEERWISKVRPLQFEHDPLIIIAIRSIGVSNFTVEQLQKLLKTAVIRPAVNQVSPSKN
jgi:uncharacterized protein related to proFAR isomerase